MKIWEYMVNSAILGTEKPVPGRPDLPEELNLVFDQIGNASHLDRESKFLQQAAIVCNYRRSGFQPLQKSDVQVSNAEPEGLAYAGGTAILALSKVLNEGSFPLLELWMQRCSANQQLVPPDLLPDVLDKADYHSSIRRMTIACAGNRGKWLSQFNPDWDYFKPDLPDEEVWFNGKPEERTSLLKNIRVTDADRAREMIVHTWAQENAAQRLELLKALRQNPQITDLPWLESLSLEKGQKVKDEVLYLLRQIHGSSINQQYESFLAEAFSLKKEKTLMGMVSKTVLQFNFPTVVDDSIYKSGIEKLAGANSKLSDEEYITAQVIEYVSPVFWEKQLDASPEQVVAYFVKYADKFTGSLGIAVSRFKQINWISHFLGQQILYADFLSMMIPADQGKYLLRFKDSLPNDVVHYALSMNEEWSNEFAIKILKMMSADPYRYNANTYRKNINLIPVGMLNQLDNFVPDKTENVPAWENIKKELQILLSLKQQILQAFTNKNIEP